MYRNLLAGLFFFQFLSSLGLAQHISSPDDTAYTATRPIESITAMPASEAVLDRQTMEELSGLYQGLGGILAQSVTGFGQSTESFTNWGQQLRGREYLVLIDGIPQNTTLRPVFRELHTIDPGVLERVEVVKGATGMYGNGAVGGYINYITLTPSPEGFQSRTKAGADAALTDPGTRPGYRFAQTITDGSNRFKYLLSGSFRQSGLYKDARGDIVPTDPLGRGGWPQSDTYNLLAKLAYKVGENQQLQLMYNLYAYEQDTEYKTISGTFPHQKATAEQGIVQGEPQSVRGNRNLRLNYRWGDAIANTSIHANLYHRNLETVLRFYPGYRNGGQDYLTSEKYGGRFHLESPFSLSQLIEGNINYGIDLQRDHTRQRLLDGRTITPEMKITSRAPFVQIKTRLGSSWILDGGLRLDALGIKIPDYTTVEQFNSTTRTFYGGVDVTGGTLDFRAFTYNIGLTYQKHEQFRSYARLSRGFTTGDLGYTLMHTTEPGTVQLMDPKPRLVQDYEAGINVRYGWIQANMSGFISTSDLGSVYRYTVDRVFTLPSSPELIYGFEISLNLQPAKRIGLGTSFSITEGRIDQNNNGKYDDYQDEYLPNDRISPAKFTAYFQYSLSTKLSTRLSVLHSLDRPRFKPDLKNGRYLHYRNNIDSYTVVDFYSSYKLPFGSFSVGISNLLNNDYYPAISQWAGYVSSAYYAKAPGARLTATLTISL